MKMNEIIALEEYQNRNFHLSYYDAAKTKNGIKMSMMDDDGAEKESLQNLENGNFCMLHKIPIVKKLFLIHGLRFMRINK